MRRQSSSLRCMDMASWTAGGMREKCDEAGLKGILLYVGGNIVVGKQPFEEVEKRFKDMGFDKVFGPGTPPETTIAALKKDFEAIEAKGSARHEAHLAH